MGTPSPAADRKRAGTGPAAATVAAGAASRGGSEIHGQPLTANQITTAASTNCTTSATTRTRTPAPDSSSLRPGIGRA
ncbi:MAG: hypothetical protein MUF56_08900 [Solirubrobacteraceae bacterium]|nr:hypothetical protein [Solirubrobacteraceae bacterium]